MLYSQIRNKFIYILSYLSYFWLINISTGYSSRKLLYRNAELLQPSDYATSCLHKHVSKTISEIVMLHIIIPDGDDNSAKSPLISLSSISCQSFVVAVLVTSSRPNLMLLWFLSNVEESCSSLQESSEACTIYAKKLWSSPVGLWLPKTLLTLYISNC